MSTTTVTGTIHGVNNTALANKWITFRLLQLGTDSGSTVTVARSSSSVQTDSNGDFSVNIWDNGESGKKSILEITVQGSRPELVIIPEATASIELWDLIENYQADGSNQEQVPVESALFVRKSNNLSDLSSAPTSRTNLGVAIGTDVQAHSAVLDATTASFTTADESKLDGIEAGATVDQTPAEIKTAYESNADTNVFDDADVTKLAGIEAGATVDQTPAEIKTSYESNADTNAFEDADVTKLAGIEAGADVTDATNIAASGGYVAGGTDVALTDGGTGASDAPTARTNLGLIIGSDVQAHSTVLDATTASFTGADETKLDGIEALADVTDATNIAASGGYVAGGTDVALTDGGTGASDAPTARTNLGFQTNATGAVTPVTVASYTVLSTDRVLTVDDTTIGSAVTLNLPSAATLGSGWTLDVKKTGSTYSVTIDPDLAETIDGDSSLIITEKNQSVKLISNGSNWEVLFPHRITGWAIYDDQASHTSAITVNNTKHLITIDGLGTTTNTTYLPAAVTEFWNTTDDKIVPAKLGDAYDIRLDFKAQPTNQADYANLILDVGTTGSPIPIVNRSIAFLKTGISSFSVGFPIGTLSDFLTNGGKFYFDTSVSGDSVDISDVVLFIKRDYSTL